MKKNIFFIFFCLCLFLQIKTFAQTILLQEDFSAGTLPPGWMNDSLGNTGSFLWEFNNPGARQIIGSNFDTSFVILDSDHYGIGNEQHASLTTAPVSTAGFASLTLEFDEQYFGQPINGSLRTIEASGDSGASWYILVSDSASVGYPVAVHTIFNLDTLAGSANVMVRYTYSGSWDYWWALDNVKLSALAACTTPPVVGEASSSHDSVCAGGNFMLSLQNDSVAAGLLYQWQISADSISWSSISGAGSSSFNTSQSVSSYYRCYVTCSGQSDTSAAVFVGINPAQLCYCIPQSAGCNSTNYISKVTITGTSLSNNSACQDNDSGYAYVAYPSSGNTTTTLLQNGSYVFEIYSVGSNAVSLWIDYDHSGTFDSVECRHITTGSTQGIPDTVTVHIPDTARQGYTGFRVRTRAAGNTIYASDACTAFASGETEDYYISIDTLLNATKEITSEDFILYPNPANQFIKVHFRSTITKKTIVILRNLLGAELSGQTLVEGNELSFDIAGLANGVYFIQVIQEDQTINKRFVVAGK